MVKHGEMIEWLSAGSIGNINALNHSDTRPRIIIANRVGIIKKVLHLLNKASMPIGYLAGKELVIFKI